jgi:hypothetical protein
MRLITPKPPLIGMVDGGATMLEFEFSVHGSGLANGKNGARSGWAVFQT